MYSQKFSISGTVKDKTAGEALIGANVLYAEGKGAITDINGDFKLELEKGEYTITVSYVGYVSMTKKINLTQNTTLNFGLETKTLKEVQIVADIAIDRETPVAFTNIAKAKIAEELSSRDLPMLLNSTPGVQATQQGGGDGDARITIRGFSQRNISVMIDGVPVNDMENGWVYWSNWFGLDAITQTMQVQRGLGATKIASPAVGGTLNIITQGIGNKPGLKIKQEYGSNEFLRTSIAYNSGRTKKGWGLTVAGSFKQGDGWIDNTPTQGFFYYFKLQKKLKKHLLSFSAFGAPQRHAQRSFKNPISLYNHEYARQVGIPDSVIADSEERGIDYNEHYGNYQELKPNGIVGNQVIDTLKGNNVFLSERLNYFHKPQITLSDFWQISDKLFLSNIAYVSIGDGGGTGLNSFSGVEYTENGEIDFQRIWNTNVFGSPFAPTSVDPSIDSNEFKSSNFIRSSINQHFWYGLLSTASYQIDNLTDLSFGVDYRSYKGTHFREVYDLLGGDYIVNNSNINDENTIKRVGDKISYHDEGHVQWAGGFAQIEQKRGLFSYFLSGSFVMSGYKAVDYFRPKTLALNDTTYELGWADTLTVDGKTYNNSSEEVKTYETPWIWMPGFTIKGGVNANLNDHFSIFTNLGYLSRTPRFDNVLDRNNELFEDVTNEIIKAAELGISYRSKLFSANLNSYYTVWDNKPVDNGLRVPDPEEPGENITLNINGMNAVHMGTELDFAYRITPKLTFEGVISIGDWTWQAKDSVQLFNDNGRPIKNTDGTDYYVAFDATDVHVGDAAQSQYSASIRYAPIKNFYIKAQSTYFDRYFAEFDPFSLSGVNARRESWRIPGYNVTNVFAGYSLYYDKFNIKFKGGVTNVFDEVYVSDAQNNDSFSTPYTDFDAKSAGVFFGIGRRFNISLELNF